MSFVHRSVKLVSGLIGRNAPPKYAAKILKEWKLAQPVEDIKIQFRDLKFELEK